MMFMEKNKFVVLFVVCCVIEFVFICESSIFFVVIVFEVVSWLSL